MKIINEIDNNTLGSGLDIVDNMYYRYKIVSYNKPIIISFPPLGVHKTDINDNTVIWGFNFLCSFDLNVISFGCIGDNNYYNSDSFIDFMEKLAGKINIFPNCLGYGFSRGGFGVGAYANLLSLDKILMVHPVSTKNKEKVPWDNRRTTDLAQSLDWSKRYTDISIPESCKVWIIYDPLNIVDKQHADRYTGRFVSKIKVLGMGHGEGINFLVPNSNKWRQIMKSFIYNDELDKDALFKFKRYLRSSPSYYKNMIRSVNDGFKKNTLNKSLNKVKKISHLYTDNLQLSNQTIEFLRDSAVKLENDNMKMSLELMNLAHLARPQGPFIKKKMAEYEKALKEQKKE